MDNSIKERFEQLKKQVQTELAPQIIQQESPLSFVSPTEFVELPSKGKFYPEEHPLHNSETVEIKQMTAKEEDILTNKSLIKKGVVIDRLIESLMVNKSIDVSSLLVGDKNAIMVAARIAAYGAEYDVSVSCMDCGSKNILNIDLQEITSHEAPKILQEAFGESSVNSERLESGNILVRLPRTGWQVECRLMNGVDEKKILNLLEVKKKFDPNPELSVSEQLNIIAESINEVKDRAIIKQAIDSMPAFDAKHLRKVYQKMIPNVRIEKKFICSSCQAEQELEVPFTQEFFWPK